MRMTRCRKSRNHHKNCMCTHTLVHPPCLGIDQDQGKIKDGQFSGYEARSPPKSKTKVLTPYPVVLPAPLGRVADVGTGPTGPHSTRGDTTGGATGASGIAPTWRKRAKNRRRKGTMATSMMPTIYEDKTENDNMELEESIQNETLEGGDLPPLHSRENAAHFLPYWMRRLQHHRHATTRGPIR